jgi:phosphoglycolate phosphatase
MTKRPPLPSFIVGGTLPSGTGQLYAVMLQHPDVYLPLPMAPQLVFPGVFDGLSSLRQDGFQLAVATSKFIANAEALLVAAGLREEFAVVVGADQVARPKPDPESGFVVLQRLGVSASNAVMVGDTTHDVLMAHAAGMSSIGVTYGVHSVEQLLSANPTWLVDSFPGVVAAVGECP